MCMIDWVLFGWATIRLVICGCCLKVLLGVLRDLKDLRNVSLVESTELDRLGKEIPELVKGNIPS